MVVVVATWLWFSSHNDISRRWRNRLAHGELSCSPRRLILVPGSRSAASNHNPLRHHFHNPTRRHYLLTSASFPSSLTLSLQPATVCSPTAAGNSAKSSLKGQQLLEVVARLHCCGAPNPWQHRMFILNRNVRTYPSIHYRSSQRHTASDFREYRVASSNLAYTLLHYRE